MGDGNPRGKLRSLMLRTVHCQVTTDVFPDMWATNGTGATSDIFCEFNKQHEGERNVQDEMGGVFKMLRNLYKILDGKFLRLLPPAIYDLTTQA
jgi:hypothetical protein